MLAPVGAPKVSLGRVLEHTLGRFKGKVDFRIDAAAIMLTTPACAFFTRSYDIHDLLALPSAVKLTGAAFLNATPVEKAERIVRALIAPLEDCRLRSGTKEPSIAIVNGTHLIINATGLMHFEIVALLGACGRVADCSVAIRTELLEVDRLFYAAVKNAKPVDVEEQEQKFLLKKPLEGDELYKLLPKQKKAQPHHEIRVNNGEDAAPLSRAEARRCLPTPEQARKADKTPQVYFEGISFLAGVQVTADRRFTRLRLSEKSIQLGQIKKGTVLVDNAGTTVDTETPFLQEDSHTRVVEIPDGGSVLIPVVYRPGTLREREALVDHRGPGADYHRGRRTSAPRGLVAAQRALARLNGRARRSGRRSG